MKPLFIFLFAITATQSFGQTTNADTTLQVICAYKSIIEPKPAIFINGKYVMNQNIFTTLNPNHIENIEVIKRDTLIANISYGGQIYIKTKSNYAPKFITLADLKAKYTDFKEKPVVFMLDGNFVNANYENYLVDENNLLTIIVDKIEIGKEKTELGLVKLLTKTEDNIKSRNKIMIRGTETSMIK